MLKSRLLTALILLPLILYIIVFSPHLLFLGFLLTVTLAAAWEWSSLLHNTNTFHRMLFIGILALVVGYVLSRPSTYLLYVSLIAALWMWSAVLLYQYKNLSFGLHLTYLNMVLGVVSLAGFVLSIIILRQHSGVAPYWLLYTLFIAWIGDSAAFFGGRFFGGSKLCLKVSPNKTWSGFFSGLGAIGVFCVLVILMLPASIAFKQQFTLFVLTVVVYLASVMGDLSISLLKRLSGVKDTSHLLPGHGGLLDRLDSILAAAIVMVVGLLNLGV